MAGVVKSVEELQQQKAEPIIHKETKEGLLGTPQSINDIHIEFYRYFNVNPIEGGDTAQLRKIYEWAIGDSKSIAQALRKVRNLELKLGQPTKVGETRVGKLYNWIRITEQIKAIQNKMKEEVGKVKAKYKAELSNVGSTYKDLKITRLNQEIKELENKYKEIKRILRLNATNQARNIKKKYEKQLAELKAIRQIYTGGEK